MERFLSGRVFSPPPMDGEQKPKQQRGGDFEWSVGEGVTFRQIHLLHIPVPSFFPIPYLNLPF